LLVLPVLARVRIAAQDCDTGTRSRIMRTPHRRDGRSGLANEVHSLLNPCGQHRNACHPSGRAAQWRRRSKDKQSHRQACDDERSSVRTATRAHRPSRVYAEAASSMRADRTRDRSRNAEASDRDAQPPPKKPRCAQRAVIRLVEVLQGGRALGKLRPRARGPNKSACS